MIKPRRAVAMAAAAFALAFGALAAPASAATHSVAAGGAQVTLHEVTGTGVNGGTAVVAVPAVGALKSQSASPAFSTCSVSEFGYAGAMICYTTPLPVRDSNGNLVEYFVIGTNWAIWHAWPGSDGWHSLGGVAEHTTANGVYLVSLDPYTIETNGTNGEAYCDYWGIPAWSGWHAC